MKSKIILGIIIIIIIIGIIIYSYTSQTQTKNYNSTYISFTYPSTWNINGNATNTSVFMRINDNSSFFIAYGPNSLSSIAANDGVSDNLTDMANYEFSSNNFTNITNINVNGIPGVMAYTNDPSTGYHAQVYFAVGNNLYWFSFYDANPNDDNTNINDFFIVINSTKAK